MASDTARTTNLMDNHPSEEFEFSLRDILTVLFRHKTKIIVFFAVVVPTVTLSSLLIAETYESEAKLLIRVGRESVSLDPSVSGPRMGIAQNRRNEINSEIGILTSTVLLGRVVDSVGPEWILQRVATESDSLPAMRAGAIRSLANNLTVQAEGASHIIRVGLKAGSPQRAQYTLDKLLDLYLERHIEVHRTQAPPDFFEEQSAIRLERLTAKEAELQDFRKQHSITSMERQKELLLSEISGLQTTVDELSSEIESSQAKIRILENNLHSRSAAAELRLVQGLPNSVAEGIKSRLIGLKLEEVTLASRLHDDEAPLVDIREQIRLAEAELAKEEQHAADSNYQQLQLDLMTDRSLLSANSARLQSLTRLLDGRKSALSRLTAQETAFARLQRQLDIAEQEYREYAEKKKRANISAALDADKISNVSVVQPASYPTSTGTRKLSKYFLLSIFLGLFGGIGFAYLLEFFDDTLKTRDDIGKRLGLPVLASFTPEEYRGCT